MQAAPLTGFTNPAPGTSGSAASGANQAEELKTEFLTLLITQLQQQDPLNPQDPSEFTSQLAQFTSLEQLIDINSALKNQATLQTAAIQTSTASFIGKIGEVAGNQLEVENGEATGFGRFTLEADSADTVVTVFNENDVAVRTINLGSSRAGTNDFVWDGLTDSGDAAPDGQYRFEVTASDVNGDAVNAELSSVGRIESVSFSGENVILEINGEFHAMGDLITLSETLPQFETPADDSTEPPAETPVAPTRLDPAAERFRALFG